MGLVLEAMDYDDLPSDGRSIISGILRPVVALATSANPLGAETWAMSIDAIGELVRVLAADRDAYRDLAKERDRLLNEALAALAQTDWGLQ